MEEVGREEGSGIVRVKVNPKFYRPTEVDLLIGDPTKANKTLGWKAKVTLKVPSFPPLIPLMRLHPVMGSSRG